MRILRVNRLTGAVVFCNEETKQWDSPEESKQEFVPSNTDEISRVTAPAADFPDNHPEKIFMYTGQLHQDCLLADAIVHSAPEARQFTRKDFQSAERCVAYITGALDALRGKVEIIGRERYEFAFGNQKVIVGNAVDSFNRYVAAHPESANSNGVDTLVRALVNEHLANWVEFPVAQATMMPTKRANQQTVPSQPKR